MAARIDFFESTAEGGPASGVPDAGWNVTPLTCTPQSEGVSCTGEFITNSLSGTGDSASAFMLEPDGSRTISDIIDVSWSSQFRDALGRNVAFVVVGFQSDLNDDFSPLNPGINALIEDGTLQRLLSGFFDGSLPLGLILFAQSDVESSVPEPASLALFGLGLGLLPLLRLVSKKRR